MNFSDIFTNPEQYAIPAAAKKKKRGKRKKKEDSNLQNEILLILLRHPHGVYLLELRKILGTKTVIEKSEYKGKAVEIRKTKDRFTKDKVLFNLQKMAVNETVKISGAGDFVELTGKGLELAKDSKK